MTNLQIELFWYEIADTAKACFIFPAKPAEVYFGK